MMTVRALAFRVFDFLASTEFTRRMSFNIPNSHHVFVKRHQAEKKFYAVELVSTQGERNNRLSNLRKFGVDSIPLTIFILYVTRKFLGLLPVTGLTILFAWSSQGGNELTSGLAFFAGVLLTEYGGENKPMS